MSDTLEPTPDENNIIDIETADGRNSTIDRETSIEEDAYTALTNDLEKLLAEARPRLTRLALAYGVPSDGVEDVVQETLVNAWQNLDHLRAPDRFEAWLNGICRNVSMRWTRAQGAIDRRQLFRPINSFCSTNAL